MALLEVKDLSVSFAAEDRIIDAVKKVSFTLEKGEIMALVGESGSGKSVTALSFLQLLPYPAASHPSGAIVFDGNDLMKASGPDLRAIRGKRIGMIFQEPMTALNPLHTIGKQIEEAITIHQSLNKSELEARAKTLLDRVELDHFKDRLDAYPHQLSGGERQRVMIAIALANDPDILIADEPTTALDVTTQQEILKLIKELRAKLGMAVLLITHDLTLVRKMADKVAIMSQGEMVEQGKMEAVFSNPSHAYTKHLLSSEPKGTPLPYDQNAPEIISCERLNVRFPLTFGILGRPKTYLNAVENATIAIREGETLGVVGESGSGKSTLAFALLRLIKSEGPVVFLGQNIERFTSNQMRGLRNQMQVVFQDPFSSLNPRMSVGDIISEGLEVHEPRISAAEKEQRLEEILDDVGLTHDMKQRYPHEFSGGQRQRISIARAMILRPRFVVLDEPTSALDLSVQGQILALLKKLQEKHGLAYMFISHDLRVIRTISHHIIVMQRGKIVESGDTSQIFTAPREDYTKTLINAAFSTEL